MRSSRSGHILIMALAALALVGCATAGGANAPSDRPIQAVATTGMIGDALAAIGGEHVSVTTLMGPGVDPHVYKASARDVGTLSEAELIYYNGLHLEAAMGEVLEQMDGRTSTIAVAGQLPPDQLISSPDYPGQYDPHVWFDVRLWMTAVERIRDGLIELDPDNEADYRANAEAYLGQLEELDAYVGAQAERIEPDQRALITAHDAFNYFGRRYGFEVHGLQGISTATEAGAGDIQQLAEFIVQREIPAVFVESSVPVRNIEAVQAAVRSRGFEVSIGEELFSDALGDPGTVEGTYVGMVRHNIDAIVAGLLGEVQ